MLYYPARLMHILCLRNLPDQKSLLKNVIGLVKRYVKELKKT
jgi:hypothetical protein